ncbi:MAG: response regulator [Oscillospiraceae bacterium]|nr:response regulator [Oscillospiraceae bacterium]
MAGVLSLFIVSLIMSCLIAYILALFWFGDTRNRRIRGFFMLGIEVFAWMLLNAITMVCSDEYFPYIYSLRMVAVCIIPFGVTWFILNFVGSSLCKQAWSRNLFIALASVDIVCMLTNPLHYWYFSSYENPIPTRAPIFWIHMALGALLIIIAFVFLLRFIIINARKNPLMILTGVGMIIPYAINTLYSLNVLPIEHDISPIGFFFMFFLFEYVAYRSKLFNVKTSLFSSTMDSLDELIVICNDKNVITDINERAQEVFRDFPVTVGRTKTDAFCNYFTSIVADEKSVSMIKNLKNSQDVDGECAIAFPDGMTRTYNLTRRAVFEGKKRTGFILLLTDVSNYKEMISEINKQNDELLDLKVKAETASRAKSDFLANMSHEIRTPMNTIIGMASIGKVATDIERIRYCFSKIEDASKHLLGIINDILDMSKIEAGKFTLSPTEFNFENMLHRVVNVINLRMDEKLQKFSFHIDDAIPTVLIGDDQRIAQVIANLLSNAVKFTPNEGSISLDTRFLGEKDDVCEIQVKVEDTGIGISHEQQTRLFEAFQQAETNTTRQFGGTGLGLTISKRIVESMGGNIWVESEPGVGSTFVFTIHAKRAADSGQNYTPTETEWNDIRILAVDDDPDVLAHIEVMTQKLGIKCDIAGSGKEALKLVEINGSYDIYFVDWKMPEINGIDLVGQLKETVPAPGKLSIVMISAVEWSTIEKVAKEAGVNKFLSKPLFPSDIVDSINEYIGMNRKALEKRQPDIDGLFAGRRILLAEDVDINCEVVLALLQPTLLEIDCAENGMEAVKAFREAPEKYDMIFMDLQMPMVDGYEATRQIRALDCPSAKSIPIIAMTANVFKEDVENCIKAGMNDHIGKPLDLDELISKMNRYLR